VARAVRNPKIDTRSARARLAQRREPYWTVISGGCALGYRRGANGGTWIAKFRTENGKRYLEALGPADDARDADGLTVFSCGQAQERARKWFQRQAREVAGDLAPLDRAYTVADALADYRADYLRRGGKAVDRADWSADAWIKPELGDIDLAKLTKTRIVAWHFKVAETPPRLRAKAKAEPRHRAADTSPEAVRRRRSTANRVLTILKAALNHAHREGKCASDDAWRTVRAFREVDAARLRYLSDDEARRLTNACPADFRALVTGALLSGCRYGELAAMTVEDFNPDAGSAADAAVLREGVSVLLRVLYPACPHITQALWHELGFTATAGDLLDAPMPAVDEAALVQDEIELVLQIAGKTRGAIRVPAQADKAAIERTALDSPEFARFGDGKPARKVVIVPGRLVNVVV